MIIFMKFLGMVTDSSFMTIVSEEKYAMIQEQPCVDPKTIDSSCKFECSPPDNANMLSTGWKGIVYCKFVKLSKTEWRSWRKQTIFQQSWLSGEYPPVGKKHKQGIDLRIGLQIPLARLFSRRCSFWLALIENDAVVYTKSAAHKTCICVNMARSLFQSTR